MPEGQDTMWLKMEPEVEAGATSQEDLYIWLGNLIFGPFWDPLMGGLSYPE